MYIKFIFILIVVLDQLSKAMIRSKFELDTSIPLIGSFLKLTYIENFGGAFGIFSGSRVFLIANALIFIIAILIYWYRTKRRTFWFNVSLIMILAGALSNMIDRIFKESVTDFIHVLSFPVFNLADVSITLGFCFFVYYSLKHV